MGRSRFADGLFQPDGAARDRPVVRPQPALSDVETRRVHRAGCCSRSASKLRIQAGQAGLENALTRRGQFPARRGRAGPCRSGEKALRRGARSGQLARRHRERADMNPQKPPGARLISSGRAASSTRFAVHVISSVTGSGSTASGSRAGGADEAGLVERRVDRRCRLLTAVSSLRLVRPVSHSARNERAVVARACGLPDGMRCGHA